MKHPPRIRDIPTLRNLLEQARQHSQLKAMLPVLGPILRIIGVNTDDMKKVLEDVDDLARRADALVDVPDRFNSVFSPLRLDHL